MATDHPRGMPRRRNARHLHAGGHVKVLLADDHRLIIEGVKLKLAELDPAVEVVVAMRQDELEQALAEHRDSLDLALLDISMPGTHGHAHIARLREAAPALPIIVLSGTEDVALMRTLMELGVQGFIPKAYSPEVMLSAIRLVLAGGIYVPPLLLASAQAQGWQPGDARLQQATTGAAAAPAAAGTPSLDGLRRLLTERQIDVMRLLSQGKPNKLIARDLGISEGTVKIHLAAIFRALNVRNRVEAVVASRRLQGL
ncbi:LuxR family two component transcriptional regulator [Thermomonas haemolytica]|uniref:LuxR family two component transcriptional regulator n=1 Tax=Thermomonas haemolytica TaxID=141949 RepID=A0A4V2V2Q3_9GAMM|nr:LuxR family two component transcriptional regulator [Thermomonas haemolytica]